MILKPLPLDNPWKRSAIGFFICNMMLTFMLFVVLDLKGCSTHSIYPISLTVGIITAILMMLGSVFNKIIRVKNYVFILGIFGIFPMLLFCMSPLFAYITVFVKSNRVGLFVISLYVTSAMIWVAMKIREAVAIEKNFDYLASHIFEYNMEKYLDRDNLREFSSLKVNPTANYRFLKSILIPVSFAGYPLQKIINSVGGEAGVLLFLSVISVPLSIYILGRFATGYYIWIYLVGKYERVNNKNLLMKVSL